MNKRILVALFALLALAFRGNAQCTITLGIIDPTKCVGSVLDVPYTMSPPGCCTDIKIQISQPNSPSNFSPFSIEGPGNSITIPPTFQRAKYGVRLVCIATSVPSINIRQFDVDTLDFSPGPQLTLQLLPPIRPSYCPTDTIRFKIVNISNVTPGYTIQWGKNGTPQDGEIDSIYSFTNLANNDQVYAAISKGNKCAQNGTGYSDTLHIVVSKKPKIKVVLAPGSTGCEKSPNTFIAKLDSAGTDPFITWFKVAPWGTVPLDSGINDTTFTPLPIDSLKFGYQICAEVRTDRCKLTARDCFSIKACGEVFLDPPLDATACAGSLFKVPYTILGSFLSTNVFQVQLSDSDGNFSSPVTIGSLVSNVADTIDVLIPDNTPVGNCYKVRVISSSPRDTSDTSSCIKVFPKPPVPQTVNDSVCKQGLVTLAAISALPGVSFEWFTSPFGGSPVFNGSELTLTISHDTTFYVSLVSTDGCRSDRVPVMGIINPTPLVDAGPNQRVCKGVSTVLLSPFPAGGVWSGDLQVVSNSVDITNTAPGVYFLIYSVVNSLGCTGFDSIRLRIVAKPEVDAGQDLVICKNALPILLVGNPTGGIWSGNGVTSDGTFIPSDPAITSLIDTVTYTFSANGCSNTDTAIIEVRPAPGNFTVTTTDPTICGATDGTATITGITTGPGFTIKWSVASSDSASDPTISSLSAGSYTVTITDTLTKCSRTVGFALSDPTAQVPVISGLNPTYCSQDNAVTLSAIPSGGTFGGAGVIGNQFDPTQASIGVNIITYSYDAGGGCTGASTALVTVNLSPVVNAGGPSDTLCSDAPSFTLNGFSPAFPTASWSSAPLVSPQGVVNPAQAALGSNTLTLSSTLIGCTTFRTRELFVYQKPVPTITRFPITDLCQGGIITLTANTQGGVVPTRYEWFKNNIIIPNENNNTLSVTESGQYTVRVVGLGTCEGTSSLITIAFNALPVTNVTPSGILTPCSNTPTVLTADSLSGYTFLWYLGADSITGATNRSYTPFASGLYKVKITNALGCSSFSAIIDVTIKQAPLVPIISPPFADTCLQQGQPVTIIAGASGSGLTYQWFKVGTPDILLTGETNATITLSTSGSYYVTVFSSNGCQTNSININLKPTIQITIQDSIVEKCQGEEEFVVGGLSPTGGTLLFNGSPLIGNLFNPAQAGDFVLTYVCTNANGCQSRKNVIIRVTPKPAAVLTVQGASNLCVGDSVRLIVNDGSNNGCVYQLIRNGSNFGAPGTSPFIFVKGDGNYSVKVTCNECATVSNSILIKFGKRPLVNAGPDLRACSPKTLNLNGVGVTPGGFWSGSTHVTTDGNYNSGTFIGCDTLTYQVDSSNGCSNADQRVVCTDATPDFSTSAQNSTACMASNGMAWVVNAPDTGYGFQWTKAGNATILGTNDSLSNLLPGLYQVKISDSLSNCFTTRTAIINSPNNLDIAISGLPDSVCSNGALIDLTGIPADSGTFSSMFNRVVQTNRFDPSLPGPLLDTVFYTVQINGCVGTGKKGIKINPLPTVDAGADTAICFGDLITLNALQPAGVPLIWSGNGVINDDQFSAPDNVTPFSIVTFGYSEKGCSNTSSKKITINTLPEFEITSTDVTTCGASDGSATRVILNPNNFTYDWRKLSNGATAGSGNPVTGLSVGAYSLTVTNANTGCKKLQTFSINGPTNIVPFVCLENVPASICQNEQPITIIRCPGLPTSTIFIGGIKTDILNPAAYVAPDNIGVILTDTDANGCIGVEQKIVEIKDFPSINTTAVVAKTCIGPSNVTLSGFFPATGGTWTALSAPAGFVVDPSIPTLNPSVFSNDATVKLVFSVTLPNGCTSRDTIDYKIYRTPTASVTPTSLSLCNGATGSLSSVTITPGYTYQWTVEGQPNPIGFGPNLSVSAPGFYKLIVDNNGCKSVPSSTIQVSTVAAPVIVNIGPDTSICQNTPVFQIPTPNMTGDLTDAILSWSSAVPNFIGSPGGVVTPSSAPLGGSGILVQFIVRKANCADTAYRTITVNPTVDSPITISGDTVLCGGDATYLIASSGPGFSYQWYKDEGALLGQTKDTLRVTESGKYRVRVLVNGNLACSQLSTRTVTIDVKPIPVVQITEDTLSVCFPAAPIALSDRATFVPNDGSAQWSSIDLPGIVDAAGLLKPSAIVAEGNYKLTLTKSIGSCTASDFIVIKAFAIPSATFTASAQAICDGETVVLTYSNPNNYQTTWKSGNTILATNVNTFSLTTQGGYTLEVNNNGCIGTSSSLFEVKVKPIFQMPGNSEICKNGVPKQFLVTGSSGGVSAWTGPGIDTEGNFNPALDTVPDSGPITLSYTLSNDGCSSTKDIVVTINPIPTILVVSDKDVVEIKAPAILTASGGSQYDWSPPLNLDKITGPIVIATPEETTTYNVLVTTDKGCKGTASKEIVVDQEFKIYDGFSPNGDKTNDVWVIKNIQDERYKDAIVKIYNRWGNIVFESEKGYPKPWDGKFEGEDVPPGAYYYYIELGDGFSPKSGSITLVR